MYSMSGLQEQSATIRQVICIPSHLLLVPKSAQATCMSFVPDQSVISKQTQANSALERVTILSECLEHKSQIHVRLLLALLT